jgi:hypothetical protein
VTRKEIFGKISRVTSSAFRKLGVTKASASTKNHSKKLNRPSNIARLHTIEEKQDKKLNSEKKYRGSHDLITGLVVSLHYTHDHPKSFYDWATTFDPSEYSILHCAPPYKSKAWYRWDYDKKEIERIERRYRNKVRLAELKKKYNK